MGDGGGEGKRGEGGRVGGDCDGERHRPKGAFLGKLRKLGKIRATKLSQEIQEINESTQPII